MKIRIPVWCNASVIAFLCTVPVAAQHSVARQWNELLLDSIRHDFARPTVHARNLYHTSIAMWDAWATYDPGNAQMVLFDEDHSTTDPSIEDLREEAISFACWHLLHNRFSSSPGYSTMAPQYDALHIALGYSTIGPPQSGNSPAAIGYRVAQAVLDFGATDNSNEANDYANQHYFPVNAALVPTLPGNPLITNNNRWQPLSLLFFVDQSGNPVPFGYPPFLSPEWGQVTPFSLSQKDLTVHERNGFDYWVYHDPGDPPYLGTSTAADYKWGFEMVSVWSSHLDPADGVMIDASPASIGNAALPTTAQFSSFYDFTNGGDWGTGYATNPVTGSAYTPQMVPRGDYTRILAEFWADGPDSETPPGHWFTIANYVSDHASSVKKLGGTGPVLDDLQWDVKCYLALGGAMHDCAIAAWGIKGWYDYLRPISALRLMADLGQSTDMLAANYHPDGISLHPGFVETVTLASTATGQRHEHLAGHEGKIAVYAWKGPDYITDPATDVAGVDWILAENWWPYQRPTFVTPPFAGYVSGHSTYSRAAAVVMHELTGSPYFPDGLGEFYCPQNSFLVFEDGPSVDVTLQWASYYDASDQCSLSRIWGGIHPPADDVPGRVIGQAIGTEAHSLAKQYWDGTVAPKADFTLFSTGCLGSNGIVTMDARPHALPVHGSTMTLDVTKLPPAATSAVMAVGLSNFVPGLDLTPIGMPACTLDVDPFVTENFPASAGAAEWSLTLPSTPFWLGQSLYHQVFTLDPGVNTLGVTTSRAGCALIGR